MKKIALLLAAAISSVSLFAQSVDKGELKQLKAFLAQPAAEASTNAEALKISNQNSPATWEGITVENGHITAINWKDKKLAGTLDLSGFDALQKVDVSRNRLTGFTADGDGALTELNVSQPPHRIQHRKLPADFQATGQQQPSHRHRHDKPSGAQDA